MKALIVIIGILMSCCSHSNKEIKRELTKTNISISSSKGKLFCPQDKKDFGMVKKGQRIFCSFFLKNIGIEPVDVLYYKASCNCTEVKISKQVVNPDDTLKVNLIIDTKEKYPGLHSSTVILKTNGERTFYDLWANFEIKN
jgi:hypothetical protein